MGGIRGISLSLLIVIILSTICFAADPSLKDTVIGKLTGPLGDVDAAAVWGIIISIIGILGRVILKKIPTIMRGPVSLIFWNIMKGIFGDGVVLSNNSDPEYLKKELTKKYPLLQIGIK